MKMEQNQILLRFSVVLCLVALSPCPHGIQDGLQTLTQLGQAVLHPRRHLCVHMAIDKTLFFHVSKLGSQYLL